MFLSFWGAFSYKDFFYQKACISRSENARSGSFSISCQFNFTFHFKDTIREKQPSNKTPELMKSINIAIWLVGTPNQLFIRGSSTETKFWKKWNSYWKNSVIYNFVLPILFILTLASVRAVLSGNNVFILGTLN